MAAAARMVKVEDSVAVVAAAVFVDPPVAGPSIIGKGVGQLGSTVGAEAFAHVATAGLPHMSSLPVQVSHFSRAGQVYPSIVDIAAGRRSSASCAGHGQIKKAGVAGSVSAAPARC